MSRLGRSSSGAALLAAAAAGISAADAPSSGSSASAAHHSFHDRAETGVVLSSASTAIVPHAVTTWTDALARPCSLRTTEDLQLLRAFCRSHTPPIFPAVSDGLLFDLAAYLTLTCFRKGQTLYEEGERVAHVFILLAPGTVALTQIDHGWSASSSSSLTSHLHSNSYSGSSVHRSGPSRERDREPTSPKQPLSPGARAKAMAMRGAKGGRNSTGVPTVARQSSEMAFSASSSTPAASNSSGRRSTMAGPLSSKKSRTSVPLSPSSSRHPPLLSLPTGPTMKFLASVGAGGIIGARFSKNVEKLLPKPRGQGGPGQAQTGEGKREGEEEMEPHEMWIRSSHTATARRNVHCMCLPLHLFVKFFPSDSIEEPGSAKSDYAHLPTSPKMNPFSISPHLSTTHYAEASGHAKTAAAISHASATTPPPHSHHSTTAGSAPGHRLHHSISEFSLPPAHPGQPSPLLAGAASGAGSTQLGLGLGLGLGFGKDSSVAEEDSSSSPSRPDSRAASRARSRAREETRSGTNSPAFSGAFHDPAAPQGSRAQSRNSPAMAATTAAAASSRAQSRQQGDTHSPEDRLGKSRPAPLKLGSSESAPAFSLDAPTVEMIGPSAAVAVATSIAQAESGSGAASAAASPPASIQQFSSTEVASAFAQHNEYDPMLKKPSEKTTKQLVQKGQKMWHVLTDAVGLQAHMHKRRTMHSSDADSHRSASSAHAGGSPTSPGFDMELLSASVAISSSEDLTEISNQEAEELKLKRRMVFARNMTFGGVSKWSQEKLLAFCTRMKDLRHSGRAVIYRQFDPSNQVYFVHTGQVQLQRSVSEGASGHYLDMYTDHVSSEKLLHRTHAKSALDVTTGTGALRSVSFEAVASHAPNPGQEDVKLAKAGAGSQAVREGQGYTLLREFDFVSGKVARNQTQFFALNFQHQGYALRFHLQAHRGAAEIYVCTQSLLPSSSKYTWMGSTHLSAKENAYMSTFGAGAGSGSAAAAARTAAAAAAAATMNSPSESYRSLASPGGDAPTSTANTARAGEEMSGAVATGSDMSIPVVSEDSTHLQPAESHSSASKSHHTCELLLSSLHPCFRLGWFYLCITTPKGGGSCDYSLRVSAIPSEASAWRRAGSATRAPNVQGLASLGRGAMFGLDGVLNHAARDEEAISLGETLIYAMPREDFLGFFPTLSGNPNPALAEMTRAATNWRLHRAQLHQDTLRLAQTLQPNQARQDALALSLQHYAKLSEQRALLERALQRFEDRQAAKQKVRVLEAQAEASGVVARKPVLASDAQKLRINHHYKRAPSAGPSVVGGRVVHPGSASAEASLSFDSSPSASSASPTMPPDVEATGTTGPSQRRVRDGVQEQLRANMLSDEVRMLRGFLAEEARDQRPREKPAASHHALLARETYGAHVSQIAKEKAAHGVDPRKHIALDMHALVRGDVGVHADEVAAIAESHSLDDIVAGRVPLPLPPPERLLSTAHGVLQLALKQAPRFEPVRPPAIEAKKEEVRRSEVYQITGDLMKAQLAPLKALSSVGGGVASQARAAAASLSLSSGPSRELAALERRFAAEIPPSNLLALESGEWAPPTEPQTTPRLASPSRRERRRQEAEENQAAHLPGSSGPGAAGGRATSANKNVRTVRSAVAIYTVEDPSVDKLKEFNRSMEGTYARENEFTHAFRAAGLEPRPKEWRDRPAARPSHALADRRRMDSVADKKPKALQKAWALLGHSASEPLLLMPPVTEEKQSESLQSVNEIGNGDSSIFDLTSVDAHEVAEQPEAAQSDEAEAAAQQPAAAENLVDALVSSSADPCDPLSPLLSSSGSLLLAPTTHMLPNVTLPTPADQHPPPASRSTSQRAAAKAAVEVLTQRSARSVQSAAHSQDLVPFLDESAINASLVSGVPVRHLSLAGLSAGAVDTGLPTLGTGFVVPHDARAVAIQDFPAEPPSPEAMRRLAASLGLPGSVGGGRAKPLSLQRLRAESTEFSRLVHASSVTSGPFAEKHSRAAGHRVHKGTMSFREKEQRVRELEEKQRQIDDAEQQQQHHRSSQRLRPHTAMGRLSSSSSAAASSVVDVDEMMDQRGLEEGEEVWDMDEMVAQAQQSQPEVHPQVMPARSGSAPRSSKLRSSLSTSSLTSPKAFGSSIPHSTTVGSKSIPRTVDLAVSSDGFVSGPTLIASASATGPLRAKSASSKHGHPARVGPAFLSASSADVPAMLWLAERAQQQQMQQQQQGDSPAPHESSKPVDQQALVRPVTAPLASFDPSSLSRHILPLTSSIEDRPRPSPKPKTYFQPLVLSGSSKNGGGGGVSKSASRPGSTPGSPQTPNRSRLSSRAGVRAVQAEATAGSPGSTQQRARSKSPLNAQRAGAGKREDAAVIAAMTDKSTGSNSTVTSPSHARDSQKLIKDSKLLALLEAIPSAQEAAWHLSKNKLSGTMTTHFTRRGSVTTSIMDAAFLAAVAVPMTPSEAEAAQKELHARRMLIQRQQQQEDDQTRDAAALRDAQAAEAARVAAAGEPAPSAPEESKEAEPPAGTSAALLPRVAHVAHRRTSSVSFATSFLTSPTHTATPAAATHATSSSVTSSPAGAAGLIVSDVANGVSLLKRVGSHLRSQTHWHLGSSINGGGGALPSGPSSPSNRGETLLTLAEAATPDVHTAGGSKAPSPPGELADGEGKSAGEDDATIPTLPERHPLDRASSFLMPNKIRELPVPKTSAGDAYVKPKTNPFINAPMHR